ncbi:hypothetical protein EBU24_05235 [bacterium]|jgi:hypothetical protein|nr:hypothetical protein [bacterium]
MQLTNDEQSVLSLIATANYRITQQEIADSERWLGSHPVHEIDKRESTLRKIRQIIRDLRIKRGYMILSDTNGYWLMNDRQEAIEYCERIERMAKAQAKAWFETYTAMRKNFNLTSDYFEQQGKLF